MVVDEHLESGAEVLLGKPLRCLYHRRLVELVEGAATLLEPLHQFTHDRRERQLADTVICLRRDVFEQGGGDLGQPGGCLLLEHVTR